MRKIIRIKERGKKEVEEALRMAEEIDSRAEMIEALIPLGLEAVKDLLQKEVRSLAGERYQRERPLPGRVRWWRQRSSVYLSDQKLPVMAPRVRDRRTHLEVPLMSLERLQSPRSVDTGLFKRVLKGLSCRDYEECAEAVPEAFGLSSSTVSRRYIRASAQRLKGLLGRRLEGCDFVAKKAFDVPPGLMAVYITHVLAYSTDREIRRWIHVSWSPKPRGQKLMALKRNG